MARYRVLIYDNTYYGDESERIDYGVFANADEAVAVSKKIVDDDLNAMWQPSMTAADLYQLYVSWGPDPVVLPLNPNDPRVIFSAWPYAKATMQGRCRLPRPSALNQEIENLKLCVESAARFRSLCLARDRLPRVRAPDSAGKKRRPRAMRVFCLVQLMSRLRSTPTAEAR
jgi:hypothetical protein